MIADPAERAQTYGKIDDEITGLAVAIPWLWDDQGDIESKDVNGVVSLFNSDWRRDVHVASQVGAASREALNDMGKPPPPDRAAGAS